MLCCVFAKIYPWITDLLSIMQCIRQIKSCFAPLSLLFFNQHCSCCLGHLGWFYLFYHLYYSVLTHCNVLELAFELCFVMLKPVVYCWCQTVSLNVYRYLAAWILEMIANIVSCNTVRFLVRDCPVSWHSDTLQEQTIKRLVRVNRPNRIADTTESIQQHDSSISDLL